jgi:nucleotide-binding universal stress UspA family protein
MTVITEHTPTGAAWSEAIFSRILVGVDGSPESSEAARQAARLADDSAELTLLAAYDIASAAIGGTGIGVPPYYDEELQREGAAKALEQAREQVSGHVARTRIVRGCRWDELLREAEREQDTLIAVGSHGVGRVLGIIEGSTATEIVHKAPCSVLVARAAGPAFPQPIVVGVDGSQESASAYAVARQLGERFGSDVRPVVAHGGKSVDNRLVAAILDHHHEDLPDEPVPALVAAAADADLLIVGSRGLHGIKALGSVAERVAHNAGASVLIVRHGDPRT